MVIPMIAAGMLIAPFSTNTEVRAAEPKPAIEEAWRTSPFHGAISGTTGKPIPCICRHREREFKLGEKVCLATPYGTVLARCDMAQNNTSWVPTEEPCTISERLPQSRKS